MTGVFWDDVSKDAHDPEFASAYADEANRISTIDSLANVQNDATDIQAGRRETVSRTDEALSTREITRRLNAALGGTLVAALAGSSNPKASHEWAKEDSILPQNGTITRIAFAYEQWQKIAESEGEQVTRAWFVGANPWLDNDTPANAIREGHHEEVARAAQALIDDSFSG